MQHTVPHKWPLCPPASLPSSSWRFYPRPSFLLSLYPNCLVFVLIHVSINTSSTFYHHRFFFIHPASFPVLQSDTVAYLCSFCRTRWLLWGSSRCTPCSGCSSCPRAAFRFPNGCCSGGTAPHTYRSRCRHSLPGRPLLLQKTDRTPGSPGGGGNSCPALSWVSTF